MAEGIIVILQRGQHPGEAAVSVVSQFQVVVQVWMWAGLAVGPAGDEQDRGQIFGRSLEYGGGLLDPGDKRLSFDAWVEDAGQLQSEFAGQFTGVFHPDPAGGGLAVGHPVFQLDLKPQEGLTF